LLFRGSYAKKSFLLDRIFKTNYFRFSPYFQTLKNLEIIKQNEKTRLTFILRHRNFNSYTDGHGLKDTD
jgi:hypothetical protein